MIQKKECQLLNKNYIEKSYFQNLSFFSTFGKIFPKLDFITNLTYTYIRGENYDSKNRIS